LIQQFDNKPITWYNYFLTKLFMGRRIRARAQLLCIEEVTSLHYILSKEQLRYLQHNW